MIQKQIRYLDSLSSSDVGEEVEKMGGQLIAIRFSAPKNTLADIKKHPRYEALRAVGLGTIHSWGYRTYRLINDVIDFTDFTFDRQFDPMIRYFCEEGSRTPEILDDMLKRLLKKNIHRYSVSKGMQDSDTIQSIIDYANLEGLDAHLVLSELYTSSYDNMAEALEKVLNKRFEKELFR